MNEIEEKNAIIESVTLSNADHGCLSAWLHLKYESCGQGFGGFALHSPHFDVKSSGSYCGHFIWRCLQIGGVTEWKDLPGRTIRIRADWNKVHAIGHIINDDWFNPSEDFERMRRGEKVS